MAKLLNGHWWPYLLMEEAWFRKKAKPMPYTFTIETKNSRWPPGGHICWRMKPDFERNQANAIYFRHSKLEGNRRWIVAVIEQKQKIQDGRQATIFVNGWSLISKGTKPMPYTLTIVSLKVTGDELSQLLNGNEKFKMAAKRPYLLTDEARFWKQPSQCHILSP